MLVGHFDRNNSSVEIVSSQVALIFVQMTKTNQHHWFFVNLCHSNDKYIAIKLQPFFSGLSPRSHVNITI